MHAILRFKLPDEQDQYEMHINGPKYNVMMWELTEEYLRKIYKYNASDELVKEFKQEAHDYNTPIAAKDEDIAHVIEWFAQKIRTKIAELQQDNNIVDV